GHAGHVLTLDLHGGARFAREARDGLRVLHRLGEEELQRDPLFELQVRRRDDYAHAAGAQHLFDAGFAREHLALGGDPRDAHSAALVSVGHGGCAKGWEALCSRIGGRCDKGKGPETDVIRSDLAALALTSPRGTPTTSPARSSRRGGTLGPTSG